MQENGFWTDSTMRMWMVNPKLLCNQHLLGEHVEIHMIAGCINRGKSLKGYIDNGLVQLGSIYARHSDIAYEMTKRGMNHNSHLMIYVEFKPFGYVDLNKSISDLVDRCDKCAKRICQHMFG